MQFGMMLLSCKSGNLNVAQVAAWRCRGRVPLGIDIYACLVDVHLRCVAPFADSVGLRNLHQEALGSLQLCRGCHGGCSGSGDETHCGANCIVQGPRTGALLSCGRAVT